METPLKDIEKLFVFMAKNNASDLHLKFGQKPIVRVATSIHEIGTNPLTRDDVKKLVYDILTPLQIEHFEKGGDIDFAYNLNGVGRFRISVYRERNCVALACRRVNTYIPTFEELHLPSSIKKVAEFDQGLVILAGPTGCGKSTTLASIIDYINQKQRLHIITIEDPIEYLFTDKKSFINQREIGIDVESYNLALKHVLRQDPDVILIGEMRDYESFDTALMASETGHLVFSTIHASTAAQAIERLLDLFPTQRQKLIRQTLAFNLKAVICQKLLPSCKEGIRVVPTLEVMFVNPVIQKLIQDGEDKKIQDVLKSSLSEGMQDFNQSLVYLINEGFVKRQNAIAASPNPEALKMLLKGIIVEDEHKIIG
jgi:twitching motility protein PilT